MSERELIRSLKKGDHSSYETLFNLYYVKFVNFADSILKNRTVAKDIVQEAFIRIWINREGLDENKSVENFIYVIVKRLIINHIRDSKPSESIESGATLSHASCWSGQDIDLIADETRKRIHKIISQMPPKRRAVFIMSREKGMSNKEIAQCLQVTVKAVERHMTLALAELRENIS